MEIKIWMGRDGSQMRIGKCPVCSLPDQSLVGLGAKGCWRFPQAVQWVSEAEVLSTVVRKWEVFEEV